MSRVGQKGSKGNIFWISTYCETLPITGKGEGGGWGRALQAMIPDIGNTPVMEGGLGKIPSKNYCK